MSFEFFQSCFIHCFCLFCKLTGLSLCSKAEFVCCCDSISFLQTEHKRHAVCSVSFFLLAHAVPGLWPVHTEASACPSLTQTHTFM